MLILILVRFIFVLDDYPVERDVDGGQNVMIEPKEGTGRNPELHRPRDYILYRAERSPRLDPQRHDIERYDTALTTAQVSPDGRIVSGRGS